MKNNNIKRREFMKLVAGSSAMASVGQFAMMSEAAAASSSDSTEYKALVCVFFRGGNDAFNMLVPTDVNYNDYQSIRAALAVRKKDLGLSSISNALHNGTLGTGIANPYNVDGTQESAYTKGIYDLTHKGINLGVNAVMPEFAQLITDNKISIIANSGNMVGPVTKEQIKNKTAALPLYLFAHNHQQRSLQTGQANNLSDVGWAGKIADNWQVVNGSSTLGLNISYSGSNRLQVGHKTSPLVLQAGDPETFYESDPFEERRALFEKILDLGKKSTNPFQRLESNLSSRSMNYFDSLYESWNKINVAYTTKGPYGENLFDIPSPAKIGFEYDLAAGFIPQMETIAKMVELGVKNAINTGEKKRQIFFVGIDGFDTHAAQATGHSVLLRELSLGLWKFQKAMEELGHADKVTTFSMSDFGRTLSVNAGLGTDHAWGSHHFVMGGAGNGTVGELNGGKMFGTLPELKPSGKDDYSDMGRMIPTTSQDQINSSICEWFGVEESLISEIFPNLKNFEETPNNVKSAYLKGLFVA